MPRQISNYIYGLVVLLAIEAQVASAEPSPESPHPQSASTRDTLAEPTQASSGSKNEMSAEEQRLRGMRLYVALCAECHGREGTPQESVLALLDPPPTNLRSGPYKFGETFEEIEKTIREGTGVNMFQFRNRISDEQIRRIAEYVLSLRD